MVHTKEDHLDTKRFEKTSTSVKAHKTQCVRTSAGEPQNGETADFTTSQ